MSDVDLSKPVIWTSRGNVNEADVQKFCEWQNNDGVIVFVLGARCRETGEEIKRAVYACPLSEMVGAVQASFA